MSDRREYQRVVAELLREIEARTQQLYRLAAAGARGPALVDVEQELHGMRRRLATVLD